MNVRHPWGVLQLFFIKNIFYDKMDLRLFYFPLTSCQKYSKNKVWNKVFQNEQSKICGRQPLKIWRDTVYLNRPYEKQTMKFLQEVEFIVLLQ